MSAINAAAPRAIYTDAPGAGTKLPGETPAVAPPVGAVVAAPTLAPGDTPASGPDIVTFPDGRPYRVSRTAAGHELYEHVSTQNATNGNVGKLMITIDLSPEGTATKTQKERVDSPAGAFSEGTTVTSYNAKFKPVGEVVDLRIKQATKDMTEHTVSSYTAGLETGRSTDIIQLEATADATTGEKIEGKTVVHGDWSNNGQPITDAVVPVIQRSEDVTYVTPKQGINKDTDRLLTTHRYSEGPLNALTYPEPMKVTVRFNGHGDQYLERVMEVPIDAQGNAKFSDMKVTATNDHQDWWVKGLTTARVWGGLSSQLAAVIGSRMLGGSLGTIGKALMLGGVGASGLQAIGEGHAVLDKRNDGSWARLAMSIYDTAWLGGVVWLARNKHNDFHSKIMGTPVTQQNAITSAAALGLAGNVGIMSNDSAGGYDLLSNPARLGQGTLSLLGMASPTLDTSPLKRSSALLGAADASEVPVPHGASELWSIADATHFEF